MKRKLKVMSAKTAVNGGGPLPQRPQKNQGDKNQDKAMDGPAEKKPRFNQGGGPIQNNQNQNQNKGFGGNKNNQAFGNRNKNRGGGNQNANKGNFQNQQNQVGTFII